MRPFFIFSFAIVFFACSNSSTSPNTPSTRTEATAPQSLETFADSLVRLDKYAPESLAKAADYYQRLVPADSAMADSAAVMFLHHVRGIVDSTNEKIFRDTTDYFDLVYNESPTAPEKQRKFRQQLEQQHLRMQGDGEGGVYVVPDYNWINSILQPKTSLVVDRYLTLLGKDEKDPVMLDAGLAIEINELVDRLVASEKLQEEKLPASFADHINTLHRFYLATLLFGSDNSPALEYEKLQITEQYNAGYKYLLSTYPSSNASKIVTEWQTVLKTNDQAKVEQWRKKYALY